MKWIIVYWIFPESLIVSEIHSHKYGLITYTLPLISLHHSFKTIHNDFSLNIHIYLTLIENLKVILNCLNYLSPVFLSLHIQVLEIYLQTLLTTAQPKRESELCANAELWLAEVTSTEFSGNRAEDKCSFGFF